MGFHAQQAVEKWLKAVTAAGGVRHSTIHDIDRLIEIVMATAIDVPLDRDRLAVLTQYAVPFRYDELLDAESLEREVLIALVDEVAVWVADRVGSGA
ncbi:MAG TPA: HEPN domain-containing protein [Solirubrobacterales bacterium]|nr:HEPN domain-containing protein [Solirubrobacterales bacterium]